MPVTRTTSAAAAAAQPAMVEASEPVACSGRPAMEWIGEYYIHRLIGEGGMGKVYEAEERLSRRRVALKVLRDDLARSEDGRRMFVREMTILSHLDHANVVRCLACSEAGGHLVMVLEHLNGRTLRELLKQHGRLPWAEALRIASDVAAGLGAAHAQSPPIVHRDLKPDNIMILADGHTKVMDFGIAKVLDAMGSQTVYTVGTLQYMSPEQIEGHPIDGRADLYCLGLVLYEMLTGHPPFASEAPRELLHLHCTQAPPRFGPDLARELPPGLEALVFSLLAKSPDERPPNAEAARRQMEQLRYGVAPAASTPSGAPAPVPQRSMGTIMLVERAAATSQRKGTVGVVIAVVVTVLAIGSVGAWLLFAASSPTPTRPADAASSPAASVPKPAIATTPTPTPTPKPKQAELDAKAEAIRAQALAERQAAEAAQRERQLELEREREREREREAKGRSSFLGDFFAKDASATPSTPAVEPAAAAK